MGTILMILGFSIAIGSNVVNARRLRELPAPSQTEADMNPLSVNVLGSVGVVIFVIGLGVTFL